MSDHFRKHGADAKIGRCSDPVDVLDYGGCYPVDLVELRLICRQTNLLRRERSVKMDIFEPINGLGHVAVLVVDAERSPVNNGGEPERQLALPA